MSNEQTGVALAQQLQWDGDALVEVMLAALTDANHHFACCITEGADAC